jgi:hypothetical protein
VEGVEPLREIDIVAAEAALGEHRRDVGRKLRRTGARRIDHHARETRWQR